MERVIELNLCRLAFGGDEVRSFQELERFLKSQTSSIKERRPHGRPGPYLKKRPVNQFGQTCNHMRCAN